MQSTEHTVSSQQASTGIILINEEKTGRGEDLKEGNKRNKNGGWRKEEEKGGKGRKSGEKDPKRDMHPENENFQRWNHSDRQ